MKTARNILIAFLLNLTFSVFELLGGMMTGSVAIISDAVHDAGDTLSIGISYLLERKSRKQPDETYTYGYARYSVLGGLITNLILLMGSVAVICNALVKMFDPTDIHYDGMILFAVVGVCVNFCAAYFTRNGDSLNQKAVNLHMLEDVLGWAVVLAGALVMRFTDFSFIDPLMSIGVSIFILIHAIRNLKEAGDVFLEKAPRHIEVSEIEKYMKEIEGVSDVHHIHLWTIDGKNNFATMHIVTDSDPHAIKHRIREGLKRLGIGHATIEIETSLEDCHETHCHTEHYSPTGCSHHHGYHLH